MTKKLLILLTAFLAYIGPVEAQNVHVELDYQSFRPFIHFQLDFGNQSYQTFRHGYRSAYLKGYMDGVNDSRYYRHRFTDMVSNFRMYETGYRDGFQDRALIIRLRGRAWYHRHRFAYDDYYAPAYSVRIWLSGLSLAFLQAPERRLPHHWKRRAHPRFKKYRHWYKKRRHRDYDDDYYDDDDDYRRYAYVEKRHKKRIKRYRRKARGVKQRYRQKASYKGDRRSRGRFKSKRSARSHIKKRIRKSNKKSHKRIRKARKKRRKAIRKHQKRDRKSIQKHRKRRRKAVRKAEKRHRKRGKVRQSRGGKKHKSRRSRGRDNRRGRDRDH